MINIKNKKLTIQVELKLASNFQEMTSVTALFTMLESWRSFYKEKNLKNEVIYKIYDENMKELLIK